MPLKSPQPPLSERAGAFVRAIAPDITAGIGAALFVAGVDMIHRPSALIAAGLLCLAVGLLAARRG